MLLYFMFLHLDNDLGFFILLQASENNKGNNANAKSGNGKKPGEQTLPVLFGVNHSVFFILFGFCYGFFFIELVIHFSLYGFFGAFFVGEAIPVANVIFIIFKYRSEIIF